MAGTKSYREELVGVFGHPVAENPTVVMQQAAFKALDIPWRYLTIEVSSEDLADAMKALRALNMRGINLTIPHKVAVLEHLDKITPSADLIGAVNTVINTERTLTGENTDGKGFMRSLKDDAAVDPQGKQVLIIGAGGAARAIAVELALAGVKEITILNRSRKRGEELQELISSRTSCRASFVPWEGSFSVPGQTDMIINATSIGLPPNETEKPDIQYKTISSSMIVCDVIPALSTPFLETAKKQGAFVLDGLGMLVYQGAIGFHLWTGLEAPVDVMHRALAEEFS